MKRLYLYIIKSFVGPFIMTFFIVLFVLLMQFLWKYVDDLVGKGLEFKLLAEMMFYAAFALLPLAFPLAMLLASIMTFGALGENYELVAMKSAGISLFRIMKPLIVIAVLITFAAFYFSNNIIPKTNLKFQTLMYSVKKQRPDLVLQSGVFTNEVDGYSIKVGRKNSDTKMLYDLLIYDHTGGKSNESVIVADSGLLRITEDKQFMVLTLFDGMNYADDDSQSQRGRDNNGFRRDSFKEQVIRVKVRGFGFDRKDEDFLRNKYSMLSIKELHAMEDTLFDDYYTQLSKYMVQINLNATISRKMPNLVQRNDSLKVAVDVPVADSIFDFDAFFGARDKWVQAEIAGMALQSAQNVTQNINMYESQLYGRKKWLNKYEMERHRKFTLSVAVLIFFFIGAPLGAIIRKGGLGMPVIVSILMFILYYIISMTGEKSAREDVWSMIGGMWFSSFLFLPLGVWLTYKAVTDSSIMSTETYTKLFSKLGFLKLIFKKKKED